METPQLELKHGDCLSLLEKIKSKSIDLILVDLPYGQTANNKWDIRLPLNEYIIENGKYLMIEDYFRMHWKDLKKKKCSIEELEADWKRRKHPGLWQYHNRIIKPNGAIILFANGKFTAEIMDSNPKLWRYNLIWQKTTPTGFLNANKMPLRIHEDICVFYKHLPNYHPQKTTGHSPTHAYTKHTSDGTNYGKTNLEISGGGSTERYPTSILVFPTDKQKEHYHPTQKPIALLEYLIKTYTNEGDTVLDYCFGSCSTGVAACRTNRNFIGIEKEKQYFDIGKKRVENVFSQLYCTV